MIKFIMFQKQSKHVWLKFSFCLHTCSLTKKHLTVRTKN